MAHARPPVIAFARTDGGDPRARRHPLRRSRRATPGPSGGRVLMPVMFRRDADGRVFVARDLWRDLALACQPSDVHRPRTAHWHRCRRRHARLREPGAHRSCHAADPERRRGGDHPGDGVDRFPMAFDGRQLRRWGIVTPLLGVDRQLSGPFGLGTLSMAPSSGSCWRFWSSAHHRCAPLRAPAASGAERESTPAIRHHGASRPARRVGRTDHIARPRTEPTTQCHAPEHRRC